MIEKEHITYLSCVGSVVCEIIERQRVSSGSNTQPQLGLHPHQQRDSCLVEQPGDTEI